MINFDEIVDRKNTKCVKWDIPFLEYGCDDIIPMWVADMDFKVAPEILKGLTKLLKHPVFGYMLVNNTYKNAFAKHFNTKCGHQVTKENIILFTGVVYSMNACIQLLSEKKIK